MEFDVYVSTDGGPFGLWQTRPASNPTAMFTGESNHTYAFRSVARDDAGNVEIQTVNIEASTYVPDLSPPVTQVAAVDATTPVFTITWSGSDIGGRIFFFEVFVEVDGQPAQRIQRYPGGPATAGGVQSDQRTIKQ